MGMMARFADSETGTGFIKAGWLRCAGIDEAVRDSFTSE